MMLLHSLKHLAAGQGVFDPKWKHQDVCSKTRQQPSFLNNFDVFWYQMKYLFTVCDLASQKNSYSNENQFENRWNFLLIKTTFPD